VPSLRTVDGRTLSWREVGSGSPLLCQPGGPGCSSRCFGALSDLAAERTLVLLDPRGTGDSDRPAEPSAYDLEDYAADLEAVLEHLGLERLDLLGHSHGGFVAITWGGAFPERVGRLVLAATAARFTDAIREARGERVASHRGRPYFEVAVAALRDQQAGNYTGDDELVALYERAGPLYAPVDVDITPVVDAFRRAGINADALKHFNERIAGGMDLRPQLARVEAPTLVLAGEHDPFGGPTADELAAVLPNATLVTVAGADHFAFLEPEGRASWSRAVLDFLAD
jgi:proline iminopeptidase